nr:MAG TPA: hypothetical protein [Herelleviridae sp.]
MMSGEWRVSVALRIFMSIPSILSLHQKKII